jgi:hypothetical protein
MSAADRCRACSLMWSKCVFTAHSSRPVTRSRNRTHVAIRTQRAPQVLDATTSGVSDSQNTPCRTGVSRSTRYRTAVYSPWVPPSRPVPTNP